MIARRSFEQKSTEELISLFQGTETNETVRKESFFELTYRFRKDLLEKCEINCKRFKHGANVAEIIAERTFMCYAKKGNFKIEKATCKSIDESFQLYLYAIAKNELVNYYQEQEKKSKGLFYDGTERIITELPNRAIEKLSLKNQVIYNIVRSLPKSHKAVYLTYTAYEKAGINLPKKLQEDLRTYCGGVKQGTIRTYKKEVLDKINDGLKILKLAEIDDTGS